MGLGATERRLYLLPVSHTRVISEATFDASDGFLEILNHLKDFRLEFGKLAAEPANRTAHQM